MRMFADGKVVKPGKEVETWKDKVEVVAFNMSTFGVTRAVCIYKGKFVEIELEDLENVTTEP